MASPLLCLSNQALVLLVLLISWLPEAKLDEPGRQYDLIEVFAGVGAVTKQFRRAGQRAVAVDLQYDAPLSKKGSMDLTTPSGFVSFGCN